MWPDGCLWARMLCTPRPQRGAGTCLEFAPMSGPVRSAIGQCHVCVPWVLVLVLMSGSGVRVVWVRTLAPYTWAAGVSRGICLSCHSHFTARCYPPSIP